MNHFPFALRNALLVPFTPETDRRRHIDVSGAAMGYPGARVIVQDVSIDASYLYDGGYVVNEFPQAPSGGSNVYGGLVQLLMRIGWKGKGYLTEELLPYGLFMNQAKPLTQTWNFARPYRIDPGEALTASMWPMGTTLTTPTNPGVEANSLNFGKCVGLMFHGVRVKDGNPIVLYDADQELRYHEPADPLPGVTPLVQKTLACPADSSVLLYSVSASNFNLINYDPNATNVIFSGSMLQIYSPSGRPWMSSIMSNQIPFLLPVAAGVTNQEVATYRDWIGPNNSLIALGEDRGWLKEANEQITVELEFATGAADQLVQGYQVNAAGWPVLITIRGCLEVPDA